MEIFFDSNKRFVDLHIESELSGQPFRSMNLLLFLRKVTAHQPQRHFCWAGLESVTVNPAGGYFPCFNWSGLQEDRYKMGDVYHGLDDARRRAYLSEVAVDRLDHCRDCWARQLCGGGCSACSAKLCTCVSDFENDTMRCDFFRHHFEMAIYASEEFRHKDPASWRQNVGASLACADDHYLI
jgi:uncharacterized protein